jgi:OOP family OmpA-OmpF porin
MSTRWVADAGLGWMYSSVNGQDLAGRDIRIRTRAATFEVSPRYRLGQSWQIGPAFQMLFGADTGFGPSVGNSVGTAFGGLRLAYEMSNLRFPLRFVAQGLTDFNVPDRRVDLFTAGIQIGLPIREKTAAVSNNEGKIDSIRVAQAAPIRVVLDPQKVFFGTNSAKLREPISHALAEIGNYLSTHPEAWKSVDISGHADQRGKYSYNLKLSQKRANSVLEAIAPQSEVADRVQAKGYSYKFLLDPANNKKAWAKNRRVEIVFYDVRDPEPLMKIIRELPNGMTSEGVL